MSDIAGLCRATSSIQVAICRSKRYLPPSHFLFEIKSFSLLTDSKVEKYETGVFGAGGYGWRLILYPNGDKKNNGSGYVSLYLAIADTEKLSRGWEVNVNFKLFVFDKNHNDYLTIQDADGAVTRYHELKREWGFEQLLSLESLFDSSNGYLVDDSCVFGAEVFVISHCNKRENLIMVKQPPHGSFTWKMKHFSKLDGSHYLSEHFTVGEREWKLSVHPHGYKDHKGKSLSVYLDLMHCERFPAKRVVYAEFKLRIKDQLRAHYHEKTVSHCFCSSSHSWGYPDFISLSDLHKAVKGYIKDDTLIVEVQILTMSITKAS